MNDCSLGERKNMNLPGCIVDLPTLTAKVDDSCCAVDNLPHADAIVVPRTKTTS